LKPVASARGLGIKLISNKQQIPLKKDVIISRFIKTPYLINSTKFDLRIYVLVTSFEPLRIYVYKDGICRFASKKYSSETKSKKLSKFAYLTNYSISKNGKNELYVGEFGPGGKYDMTTHKWFITLI
jgi:tubulin polyglutamylase TTLL4